MKKTSCNFNSDLFFLSATVGSHLSMHPFKSAFYDKFFRDQHFLVEHIMNRHLAQVLVFFAFGFEDDYSDLGLELFKRFFEIVECFFDFCLNVRTE